MMKGVIKDFVNGLWNENPTFRLVVGMCPTLAVTTNATNGVAMGLAASFVLVGSNAMISAMRNFISPKIRMPAFVVVIASFVTIVGMVMKAFLPELDRALGIFIPLIVVNCIIMARAEAFASKQPVVNSIADGLGMGLGFTLALVILGSIREILGNGSIFGINLFGASYEPALLLIMPPGAFMALGLLIGLINYLTRKPKDNAEKEGSH
ncbi:electron transport complex subunit RsxE [Mahella australiensis]|uniref:Ion-translocating oxidoreductase complex subunit E n=1 Tax=Mahella australiensis (strain DSM 15567 / CIP 107919 / 50-1 BON) TaxID=697281 RepID=F3ZVJ1_MAHA5|nr:electron transport complex subunit E [Mahella australiensis]AEE96353.1 electron transport complex, RnfABCDGE type, E subunit [Mahella australiensis 50-1 BON]